MGKHLSAQISSNCISNVLNKSEKPAHPIDHRKLWKRSKLQEVRQSYSYFFDR